MTSPDASPFPLGVASFDPLPDRVLLWTQVDRSGPATWEVAVDPSFVEVVASGTVGPHPQTGVVTVDVTGLTPATDHWYRFTAAGATSTVGRTRTLPAGSIDRLHIGAVCCARYGQSPFTVYGALADVDVDLVVHLGDYIYEDTKCDYEGREPEPTHDCVTVDDYRIRHAQARRDPDLQALHARHPMVVVWDDHDFADNAWRGGAKSHDGDEQGAWEPRLEAALQAHQEFLPKRLADPDDLASAWRRLDAGDLVGIVCTETRAHRDEQAGNPESAPADDPDRTMLGAEQARWLHEAVSDRSVRWVVMLSGTVVSELEIEAPEALDGVLPEKYTIVDGRAVNSDQWDGYLEERRRLIDALGRRDGGSLILSGDIHSSWAIEGPLGPDGQPVAVELVCPPAATTPLGQLLPPGAGALLGPAIAEQLPRVRWVGADEHGYLTLDIRPDAVDAAWWWVTPGETHRPQLGRRWTVPHAAPMQLVDPEGSPPVTGDAERPARVSASGPDVPSPLSQVHRAKRQRLVKAGLALAAIIVAVTIVRFRRRR